MNAPAKFPIPDTSLSSMVSDIQRKRQAEWAAERDYSRKLEKLLSRASYLIAVHANHLTTANQSTDHLERWQSDYEKASA